MLYNGAGSARLSFIRGNNLLQGLLWNRVKHECQATCLPNCKSGGILVPLAKQSALLCPASILNKFLCWISTKLWLWLMWLWGIIFTWLYNLTFVNFWTLSNLMFNTNKYFFSAVSPRQNDLRWESQIARWKSTRGSRAWKSLKIPVLSNGKNLPTYRFISSLMNLTDNWCVISR